MYVLRSEANVNLRLFFSRATVFSAEDEVRHPPVVPRVRLESTHRLVLPRLLPALLLAGVHRRRLQPVRKIVHPLISKRCCLLVYFQCRAIHLSNNSVQKHVKNQESRNARLPSDNMWTKAEFVDFLWSEGHGDVWETTVVPGMKKAILCSLLCTQEFIECRKVRLHFQNSPASLVHMHLSRSCRMLLRFTAPTSCWRPTSNPGCWKSTPVRVWLAARRRRHCLSSRCSETCWKVRLMRPCVVFVFILHVLQCLSVVLDRRHDKTAPTGAFELLYQQRYVHEPHLSDLSLAISGKRIPRPGRNGRSER